MNPALVTSGVLMSAGLIYFFGIRRLLKTRESMRLSSWNRIHLDSENPGDDQP